MADLLTLAMISTLLAGVFFGAAGALVRGARAANRQRCGAAAVIGLALMLGEIYVPASSGVLAVDAVFVVAAAGLAVQSLRQAPKPAPEPPRGPSPEFEAERNADWSDWVGWDVERPAERREAPKTR